MRFYWQLVLVTVLAIVHLNVSIPVVKDPHADDALQVDDAYKPDDYGPPKQVEPEKSIFDGKKVNNKRHKDTRAVAKKGKSQENVDKDKDENKVGMKPKKPTVQKAELHLPKKTANEMAMSKKSSHHNNEDKSHKVESNQLKVHPNSNITKHSQGQKVASENIVKNHQQNLKKELKSLEPHDSLSKKLIKGGKQPTDTSDILERLSRVKQILHENPDGKSINEVTKGKVNMQNISSTKASTASTTTVSLELVPKGDYDDFYAVTSVADEADVSVAQDSLNPVPRMPLGHLRDDIAAASVYEMIAEKGFVDDTIFLPLSAPFNEKEKISSVSNAIYLAKRYGARSIVELGDGLTAREMAADHNTVSIAFVPAKYKNLHENEMTQWPKSFFVSWIADDDDATSHTLDILLDNPQIFVDLLVISNLSTFVGSLLPHEFEKEFAKVYGLAASVIVVRESTVSKENNNYFGHWSSYKMMLRASCQGQVASNCTVVESSTGNYRYAYGVSYAQANRTLPLSMCNKINNIYRKVTPGQEDKAGSPCVIISRYNTKKTVVAQNHSIGWGKHPAKHDFVTLKRPHGLPFHIFHYFKWSSDSINYISITLLTKGTKSLLSPAVVEVDLRGTLTYSQGSLRREHIKEPGFMFTGSFWNSTNDLDIETNAIAQVDNVPKADGDLAPRGKLRRRTFGIADKASEKSPQNQTSRKITPTVTKGKARPRTYKPSGMPTTRKKIAGSVLATTPKKSAGLLGFDVFWNTLRKALPTRFATQYVSFLTYGTHVAYIGLKMSRKWKIGSSVILLPKSEQSSFRELQQAAQELSLVNTVLSGDLTESIVTSIYKSPDTIQILCIGVEIFRNLALLGENFVLFLGRLLSISKEAFLEVPPPETLSLIATFVQPISGTNKSGVFRGMVAVALRMAGVTDFELAVLDVDDEVQDKISSRLLRIKILQSARPVHIDCSSRAMGTLKRANNKVTIDRNQGKVFDLVRADSFFSLHVYMQFGLFQKSNFKEFFQQILRLPQELDNNCPRSILLAKNHLLAFGFHRPLNYLQAQLDIIKSSDEETRTSKELEDEIRGLSSVLETPFSFMEYGSGTGNLSMGIARKYPQDTVLSVEPSKHAANNHWAAIEKNNGPFNNIVCNREVNTELLAKLVECPEVLRYQYFGQQFVNRFLKARDSKGLGKILGTAFPTGVTTMLRLPSAKSISLAIAVMYHDWLTESQLEMIYGEQQELPFLENLESRFLSEITRLRAQPAPSYWSNTKDAEPVKKVKVESSVVVPVPLNGLVPPWRLLRVDVRNLSMTVNHHFDYRIDGHDRKYQLHIESNKSDWRVYLTRAHDKWKIPYEQVNSVTLIALLRMGILSEIKSKFYGKFVNMPIYEDMAPWNIVFRGGELEYIDYDTKDKPLTKIVPFAYQIMAALMNYERTVNDFGHCNGHAKNDYGFSFISHCVKSGFEGPCKESAQPVPCGDYKCYESYPACLRAMHDAETSAKHQEGAASNKALGGPWSYDSNGLISFEN
eukprot:m.4110 g.4110  ORF g.4110 m.4110 type:complete len:1510 (-) comp2904_c0_seq1:33-4562(-)